MCYIKKFAALTEAFYYGSPLLDTETFHMKKFKLQVNDKSVNSTEI